MRHLLLTGEYDLSFDEKNRVLIPSEVRRLIKPETDGDGFILVMGSNRKPWLYPDKHYEQLVSQIQEELTPDEDLLMFDQMSFGLAHRLGGWDKQGRLLLPEKMLRRTGLERDVTLVGVRNHLELWNRAEWETYREELFARSMDISRRARLARQGIVPAAPEKPANS